METFGNGGGNYVLANVNGGGALETFECTFIVSSFTNTVDFENTLRVLITSDIKHNLLSL